MSKSKFFGDKSKIFYLNNTELEYWDYNPKTLHKEEKKTIKMTDIKQCKVDVNASSITFILKNKTLVFGGKPDEVREMTEWLELCQE